MSDSFTHEIHLWPLLLYAALVLLTAAGMLLLSHFLGQRHEEPATDETYESGIPVTGSARLLFPIHFYIVAMFFVVFDLEAVFIVAWAISLRQVGWAGYAGVLIFILILVAVLIYEWRNGALDFGPNSKKILKAYYRRIQQKRKSS
ncbi:NADH dehydrogenase subunit A [Thermoflavifilum aggregans]|uniref:NADH-quinone oxidoreductase subunit A n=1 Tax=Thermoflavifilum aggregans TaxID=454188 RepID=A0A2M9CSP2_9BACT|nr:NADH-quinone oxidoreductase subunit A [Thermoflavifilum aggregans]MBX6380973.1 NADH-quinone oxidoreductase subunit A [Thermoflavifilum aggregans]PJJ74960.1 NADH dehydrogenase subunit A [Thermoflavifilum aggregans]